MRSVSISTVTDEALADLQRRLERRREVPVPELGRGAGVDPTVLAEVLRYWRDEYDWRTVGDGVAGEVVDEVCDDFLRHDEGCLSFDGNFHHGIAATVEPGRRPLPGAAIRWAFRSPVHSVTAAGAPRAATKQYQ